jgi:hypothetical protein
LVLSASGGVWENCRPGRYFRAGPILENHLETARCFICEKNIWEIAIFAVENLLTVMFSMVSLSHWGAGQDLRVLG